jgi:hypothetical protein
MKIDVTDTKECFGIDAVVILLKMIQKMPLTYMMNERGGR